MHMADALLSPGVGIGFGAASAGILAWCASKVRSTLDDHRVPLMGVLGAFVFAAQMINFTIPGTGSSGHLGGGLLLAMLLGPHAAFLTIASVLVIQALFFADGGLLALGTNLFNLGVFPCFVGLPLFRAFAGRDPFPARLSAATVGAAVAGLELGALGVVVQTVFSGRSDLAAGPFLALMGGIHLPIGVVEGLVTASVVAFVFRVRPELRDQAVRGPAARRSLAPVVLALGVTAAATGGVLAWFASPHPDGLEWTLARLTAAGGPAAPGEGVAGRLRRIQERTAVLPDYGLPAKGGEAPPAAPEPAWPAVDPGTSVAGIVGALITLAAAGVAGLALTRGRSRGGRR